MSLISSIINLRFFNMLFLNVDTVKNVTPTGEEGELTMSFFDMDDIKRI